LLLAPIGTAQAEEPSTDSALAEILRHYEAVRLVLLADTVGGITEHGNAIFGIVEELDAEWTPERAGVNSEKADEARKLLPALAASATELAEAENLGAARDAFYSLSKSMVRLRRVATGDLPVVAYCPMAKRSWLQPEGGIGNPYYGQEMPSCGEVVDG